MKKNCFILALVLGMSSLTAFAQYKPTEKDLGNDCATENGKLGTWKKVTVTETSGNSNSTGVSNSNSNTGTVGVNAKAGVGVGKSTKVEVGANASYQNSNSKTTSNNNTQSTTTSRTYDDIQCVEDKNANNPQMTPVRW